MRLIASIVFFAVSAAGQDAPTLQIRVVEGEGAAYAAGSHATRGVTVEATDGSGKPVEGAVVSFVLPADGPSGVFASGARTEIVTTGADGRAAAWGMQWNRIAGPFEVRIAAISGPLGATTRGATVWSGSLQTAADSKARASIGSRKALWIALAVAGAAVAGVSATRSKSGTAAASSSSGVVIGTPTISLGHP